MSDLSQLSAEKTLPFDESIRRVERGSQLVVAVPCDTRVVLQMPRGNLEGIHPRALVLSAVRKHLDRQEFGKAFRLMKTHRINLNLLYDHNPQAFLAHVRDFILQVDSANNINIFLTDLQEEDVTATMYSAAYSGRQSGEKEDQASKVDTVCDAVRLALEQTDKDKFLLSILTAYVRKRTPELENALQLVQDLRGQGDKASAEEALKYLLFLVDVNDLYDVALGTYNFDLVLMVAEKSQKDPKEYIPFLNGLRRMEDNYRKFSVDKHLKRYARALVHISKCPEHFKECLALVKTHGLHSAALRLFPVGSKENKELAVSYAEHLLERSKPAEAALMFYRAGKWERALEAYVSCHNWRQAFCMAAQLKYSSAQTTELAYKLAGQLKAVNKNVDAAIVYERYASDMEEAIATLIEGAQWDEAQRLMHAAGRQDFVETHLEPGLVQARDQHQEALAEARAELTQHTHRLNVVRQLKLQQEQEFLEAESRLNTADADLFSDTSSATGDSVSGFSNKSSFSNRSTLVSRTTGHSSRSRRKMEQKKWSLKKGSPFEDFALVAALSKLIERIDSWREEIGTLLRALVQYNMDEEAEALQTNYESLLDLVKKLTPEIWKDGATASTATQPTFGPGSTANSIAQAMQQGAPLQAEEKLDPVLVVPPKLRKEVSWKLQISQPLKK